MDLDQVATGLAFLALFTTAIRLFWNLTDRERASDRDDAECRQREGSDDTGRKPRDRSGMG